MPWGWGRGIVSVLGSHFGSLGRPPGTQKAIAHSRQKSSSTQLQPFGINERKNIHTSAEANSDNHDQHSYDQKDCDGHTKNNNSQTNNISDGIVENSYKRGIQIGALLAVCYNLVQSHIRLRRLQKERPLLNGSTSSRHLFTGGQHTAIVPCGPLPIYKACEPLPYGGADNALVHVPSLILSTGAQQNDANTLLASIWSTLNHIENSTTFLDKLLWPTHQSTLFNLTNLDKKPPTFSSSDIKLNQYNDGFETEYSHQQEIQNNAGVLDRSCNNLTNLNPEIQTNINEESGHDSTSYSYPRGRAGSKSKTVGTKKESTTTSGIDILFEEEKHVNERIPKSQSTTTPIPKENCPFSPIEDELMKTGELINTALDASMALDILEAGHHRKGMALLKSTAKRNYAESYFNLGVIYERGMYGRNISCDKAIHYYHEAAKLGYSAALFNLALIYENGSDVDRQHGKRLLEEAAELGLLEARKKLGLPLLNSTDTKPETTPSQCVFCKEKGWDCDEEPISPPSPCPNTCYLLARAYHRGTCGLVQDRQFALELYRTAAEEGHKKAKGAYENLKRELLQDITYKNNSSNRRVKKSSVNKKQPSPSKVPVKFLKGYFLPSSLKHKASPNICSKSPKSKAPKIGRLPRPSLHSTFDSQYVMEKRN